MSLVKDVIGYGLHSDRPASGSEGRLYYETDTDTLFRDSGTAWDALYPAHASAGGFSTPSLTVSTSISLGNAIVDAGNAKPYLDFTTTDTVTVFARYATNVPWTVVGEANQVADLQQWKDSADHVQLGIANAGSGGSPVWALRVRALANAESMGQAHTLGAYSGKSIQVLDDAGATVGWIPLYA